MINIYNKPEFLEKIIENNPIFDLTDDNVDPNSELLAGTLRVIWRQEAVEDLKFFHGGDVTEAILDALRLEVHMETTRGCLVDIKNKAAQIVVDLSSFNGKEANKVILDSIPKLGDDQWAVTSPEIASIFELADGFTPYQHKEFTYTLSVHFVGSYNGIKIYKDPLFHINELVTGLKSEYRYKIEDYDLIDIKANENTHLYDANGQRIKVYYRQSSDYNNFQKIIYMNWLN